MPTPGRRASHHRPRATHDQRQRCGGRPARASRAWVARSCHSVMRCSASTWLSPACWLLMMCFLPAAQAACSGDLVAHRLSLGGSEWFGGMPPNPAHVLRRNTSLPLQVMLASNYRCRWLVLGVPKLSRSSTSVRVWMRCAPGPSKLTPAFIRPPGPYPRSLEKRRPDTYLPTHSGRHTITEGDACATRCGHLPEAKSRSSRGILFDLQRHAASCLSADCRASQEPRRYRSISL